MGEWYSVSTQENSILVIICMRLLFGFYGRTIELSDNSLN